MAAEWCYAENGRDQGPVSASDLRKLVQAGRITGQTPIWKLGTDQRVPASRVRGLFPGSGAASSPSAARSHDAPRDDAAQAESSALQEATEASQATSSILSHVEMSAGRVVDVTRFGVGGIVQGFRHINGQMLRHLHPQRYAMACVAFFTLIGVMVEPLLRGAWTAPILQALAFVSMVPCLMVVLGDPSCRIPSNLRLMGFRWAGASILAWIAIWLVLRIFGQGSWIPLGMVFASVALFGTVIDAPPTRKPRWATGKRPKARDGNRPPRSTPRSS